MMKSWFKYNFSKKFYKEWKRFILTQYTFGIIAQALLNDRKIKKMFEKYLKEELKQKLKED